MHEAKIKVALSHCLSLASACRPSLQPVATYLHAVRDDAAWTADERAELESRIIVGLVVADGRRVTFS